MHFFYLWPPASDRFSVSVTGWGFVVLLVHHLTAHIVVNEVFIARDVMHKGATQYLTMPPHASGGEGAGAAHCYANSLTFDKRILIRTQIHDTPSTSLLLGEQVK